MRVQAAVSQDEPLAQVLSREGLSPLLQDVILYGIAMADWAQPPLQPPPPPPPLQQQLEQQLSTQQQSVQAVAGVCRHPQPQGGEGSLVTLPGFVGARAGCASLVLYTHSLGRFGAPGAFMAPAYGAGSLPEALVRHAAVHGAVTALRWVGVRQLLLLLPLLLLLNEVGDVRGPECCDVGMVGVIPWGLLSYLQSAGPVTILSWDAQRRLLPLVVQHYVMP